MNFKIIYQRISFVDVASAFVSQSHVDSFASFSFFFFFWQPSLTTQTSAMNCSNAICHNRKINKWIGHISKYSGLQLDYGFLQSIIQCVAVCVALLCISHTFVNGFPFDCRLDAIRNFCVRHLVVVVVAVFFFSDQ